MVSHFCDWRNQLGPAPLVDRACTARTAALPWCLSGRDRISFREVLTGAALPPAATKCSGLDGDSMVTCNHVSDDAFAERCVRTIKHEYLTKVIFVGESMLRRALREFVAHYHDERPHQGRGNEILRPGDAMPTTGPVPSARAARRFAAP